MAVFDADVVCGIEPMQSALKHSCQLPSVRARTGFAATDDDVGVAGASSVTRMDPSLGFRSGFGADCLRRRRGQVANNGFGNLHEIVARVTS